MTKAEYNRQYYLDHKEKWAEYRKAPGFATKHREGNRVSWQRRKSVMGPVVNGQHREAHRKVRDEVLIHYGGNPPRCACCGEHRKEFLAVDHVNGGGRRHARSVHGHVDQWLKKNNYPPGFRILCHNCNLALGAYGYCPHQSEVNESINIGLVPAST